MLSRLAQRAKEMSGVVVSNHRRETYFGHKVTITGGASGLLTYLVIEQGNPAEKW